MTTEDIIKLVLQYTGTKELKEGAEASKELKTALEDVGKAEEATQGKTEKLKEALEKAKGVLENFQSGGVESARSPLFELLGLIPGAGPAFTLLGTALEKGLPLLKTAGEYLHTAGEKAGEFKTWLLETKEAISKTTTEQEALNTAIKDYTAGLKEKEGAEKGFFEAKAAPTSAEDAAKQRGQVFTELAAGSQPEFQKQLTQALLAKPDPGPINEEYAKRVRGITAMLPPGPIRDLALAAAAKTRQRQLAGIDAEQQKEAVAKASGLLGKAGAGDADAISEIQAAMPGTSLLGRIADVASPEGRREAIQQQADIAEANRRADERQKEEAATRKENAELTKESEGRQREAFTHFQSGMNRIQREAADERKKAEEKRLADLKRHELTPAQREHRAAEASTSRVFQQETGQRASPEQARAMADEAIKNLGVVGNYNMARDMAVMAEIQRIKAAVDQMRGQVQGMSAAARFGPQPMRESNQTWGMAP